MKKKNKKFINKNVNILTIILTYAIFALIFILVASSVGNNIDVNELFDSNSNKVTDSLKEIIYKQNAVNKKIIKASTNDSYSISNPYILKNPYELNPLSAVIAFYSPYETSAEVILNDVSLGITESCKNHIIAITGLYEGTYNKVELKLDDGSFNTITIKTDELEVSKISYDNTNYDSNLFTLITDGNTIQGNDYKNNSRFLINGVENIASFEIENNNIVALFNTNIKGLYVTMDFLGHISDVSSSYENYNGNENTVTNIYSDGIRNYTITNYNEDEEYTSGNLLDLSEITNSLLTAPLYSETFDVSYNNEYLTYNIDINGYLIVVRSDGKAYSYKIDESKTIRLSDNYDYSLYLNTDSTYYNLYTIVKNS